MIRVNDDWVIMFCEPCSYSPAKDLHRKQMVKKHNGDVVEEDAFKPSGRYFTDIRGAVREIAKIEAKEAVMTHDMTLTEAIKAVSQPEVKGKFLGTAWTMVMNLTHPSVTYYSRRHFDKPFTFSLKRKK